MSFSWLAKGVDFSQMPPPSTIKGLSVALYEGLRCNIDGRLYLYHLCQSGTYCARAASTLDAELIFGEMTRSRNIELDVLLLKMWSSIWQELPWSRLSEPILTGKLLTENLWFSQLPLIKHSRIIPTRITVITVNDSVQYKKLHICCRKFYMRYGKAPVYKPKPALSGPSSVSASYNPIGSNKNAIPQVLIPRYILVSVFLLPGIYGIMESL